MKTLFIYVFVLLVFHFSCSPERKDGIQTKQIEDKISIHHIELDSLSVDLGDKVRIGEFRVINDQVYFIDTKECSALELDDFGKISASFIGLGKGPNESSLGFFDEIKVDQDKGRIIFIGPTQDFEIYDFHFNRLVSKRIPFLNRDHIAPDSKPTDIRDSALYALNYAQLDAELKENKIFISISTDHPFFNMFTSDYFVEAPLLGSFNTDTGEWQSLELSYPESYHSKSGLGHFSFYDFETDSDENWILNFEMDSLMYVYDAELKLKYAFGKQGEKMDISYTKLDIPDGQLHNPDNRSKIGEIYQSDRMEKGYFRHIYLHKSENILFRSYTKSSVDPYDGLQIYKDFQLVGDIEVPKGFEILGKIKEKYVAQIATHDSKDKYYTFQLKL